MTAPLLLGVLTGCAAGQSGLVGGGQPAAVDAAGVQRLQKPDSGPPRAAAAPAIRPPDPPNGEYAVRIRAKVNGVAILDEELKNAVYPALMEVRNAPEPQRSALQQEILQKGLDHLIEREIILGAAFSRLKGNPQGQKVLEKLKATAGKEFDKQVRDMKKRAGVKTDEEFKQILEAQGQSLDGMRRQYERTFMATEYMRFLVLSATEKIGLSEVREYYDQHPSEFRTQDNVKWQDVFVAAAKYGGLEPARRFAGELASRAQRGADFPKLVDQHDDGDSRFRGGDGYGQRRGEIKPAEAEPYLFQMRPGQVALVELPTGIHVVRLVSREYSGRMPFNEKTQNLILNKLKNEAADREWKKNVKMLKSKAIIERDLSE
jgi:hypothetical protein